MGQSSSRRGGVQSVERAMHILRTLATAGRDMTLSDLAAQVRMPASKLHRYLVSLNAAGMVAQDPITSRYDLGAAALQIGLAALGRLDAHEVARRQLAPLTEATGHTSFAATRGSAGPTVFAWVNAPSPVSVNVRVGDVLPAGDSATGQVFEAWRESSNGSATLEATRRRGLARVRETFQPGIHALSAPVFDHAGTVVAALTVLGIRGQFDDRYRGACASALLAATRAASKTLGYSG